MRIEIWTFPRKNINYRRNFYGKYDDYLHVNGAANEQIERFEEKLGIKMPEDMKELYRYKDGSEWFYLFFPNDKCDREFKYRLLSLALFNKRWIPFAEASGDVNLKMDFDPDDDGIYGQIICYIHDPDEIAYFTIHVSTQERVMYIPFHITNP